MDNHVYNKSQLCYSYIRKNILFNATNRLFDFGRNRQILVESARIPINVTRF